MRGAAALLALLALGQAAVAAPRAPSPAAQASPPGEQQAGPVVSGIGPGLIRPVTVRGGVLVLPLAAATPGRSWPPRLGLRFEDGELVPAAVAWIHPKATAALRRWTDDPTGLAVRPVGPDDDVSSAEAGATPVLVVELPLGRQGDFRLVDLHPEAEGVGRVDPSAPAVRPHWVDAATDEELTPIDPHAPALERRADPARPDPDSPFDYWRWALLAQRLERPAPAPPGEGLEALVARHGADLWRVGMRRLAGQSPGVAAACREALTNTAFDGEREIAAWITDPVETAALLTILLDFNRRDRAVMESALGWAESRNPLVVWTEQELGSMVTLAIANPLVESLELEAAWISVGGPPITRTLRGSEISRLHVARPAELPGRPLGGLDASSAPLTLSLAVKGHRRHVNIAPALAPATPPGLALPMFRPPLRLAEAHAGVQRMVEPARTTAGLLRRVNRRWELYIECARPPVDGTPAEDASVSDAALELAAVDEQASQPTVVVDEASGPASSGLPRGVEAITVSIGPRAAPHAVLCVPERGAPWMLDPGSAGGLALAGARAGATSPPADLEVHRRSLAKAWRCRIVLPESWIPAPGSGPFLLAAARTHGTDEAVETMGLPQTPWDLWPAPIAVDLGAWDGR